MRQRDVGRDPTLARKLAGWYTRDSQTCAGNRVGKMVSSPAMLVLFCVALAGAWSPGRQLQDEAPPPPLWRKLQAKMNIEFCSKNMASELEPCKVRDGRTLASVHPCLCTPCFAHRSAAPLSAQSEVFQESLKGLSLEEKKAKIDAGAGPVSNPRPRLNSCPRPVQLRGLALDLRPV